MADVKSVKATVGENQALAVLLGLAEQKGVKFVARDDFGLGAAMDGYPSRSGIVNSFAQFCVTETRAVPPYQLT